MKIEKKDNGEIDEVRFDDVDILNAMFDYCKKQGVRIPTSEWSFGVNVTENTDTGRKTVKYSFMKNEKQ
jgi:hypothetical protein